MAAFIQFLIWVFLVLLAVAAVGLGALSLLLACYIVSDIRLTRRRLYGSHATIRRD